MKIYLYRGNCRGEELNSLYPMMEKVTNADELAHVAQYDHVMAKYTGHHRSAANFESSNCIPENIDNDHSDNPDEWITAEKVAQYFTDVRYSIVYSRNHMKQKGDRSARPRMHLYFEIPEVTDVEEYGRIKKRLLEYFPYFDRNAQDAARFLYGTENPQVIWHEGSRDVMEFVDEQAFKQWEMELDKIPEGKRNATMSQFAGKVIKRYGDTDKARDIFLKRANRCSPPLPGDELDKIWRSAQNFGKRIAADPNYIPPDEFENPFMLLPEDKSDVGQAMLMLREYAWCLRYSPSTDFIVYNGSYWEESKPKAQGYSQKLTDRQLMEANAEIERTQNILKAQGVADVLDIGRRPSKGERARLDELTAEQYNLYLRHQAAQAYYNYAVKRRDSKNIANTLKECRPMLEVSQRDLDKNEFLLNTPSFTVDLRKGVEGAQEHTSEDYITKQTAVNPDETRRELWEDALDTFFVKDKELIEYVQKIVGLAAIGKVFVEALVIAYGEGRNGKGTFWNVLAKVLGSYSGKMSAETLTIGCKRNVRPELAEAKGKRLLIASELEEGMRLSTGNVKQLCSTDEISAEKKYKDPFSYVPSHTLILYTNHLPKVGAMDQGTWRRLIVIPFDAKIEGSSDIKNYTDYLFDNAGGAILSWIIEGARKVIDDDFHLTPPTRVQAAINEYRESNNWLEHFLEECCDVDASFEEKSGKVYEEYRAFCLRCGEYARSTADFYGAIEVAGFTRHRTTKARLIKGLRLKTDFE